MKVDQFGDLRAIGLLEVDVDIVVVYVGADQLAKDFTAIVAYVDWQS